MEGEEGKGEEQKAEHQHGSGSSRERGLHPPGDQETLAKYPVFKTGFVVFESLSVPPRDAPADAPLKCLGVLGLNQAIKIKRRIKAKSAIILYVYSEGLAKWIIEHFTEIKTEISENFDKEINILKSYI